MAEHTHWKKMIGANYLGSWDLDGKDMIVRITDVKNEMVQNGQRREEKTVVYLDGGLNPWILNKTNAKSIAKALGTDFVDEWVGRKVQLYTDKVASPEGIVDAIRVRDFDPEAK